MPESRRKFDPEFREGAVRIVRETGKPIAQIARDLGCTRAPWVTGLPRTVLNTMARKGFRPEDAAELKRLRAENAELRMERDVLKRSVVLWVNEATK